MTTATLAGSAAAIRALTASTVYRRAVEAAIWGMPAVSFDAMRQAYLRDAGAQYNDVIYWSKPVGWRYQAITASASTSYMIFFANLSDGPVVVDVPPSGEGGPSGALIDSWNQPLIDVGHGGEDRGRGGHYILLPPDRRIGAPANLIPVQSTTFNVCGIFRATPRTGGSEGYSRAVAELKDLKVHPTGSAAPARAFRFIDMAGRPFDGVPSYDADFYASLARIVAEEPVKERDVAIMGQLHTLGVGKDMAFQPSAATNDILRKAIHEAHAYMAESLRNAGAAWWPSRKWRCPAGEGKTQPEPGFVAGQRVLLDERAVSAFRGFGAGRAPQPDLCLMAFEDRRGETLHGGHIYRLRIPPKAPAEGFWSLTAYDNDTSAFVREAAVVGLDSRNPDLQKAADGSIELHLSPRPPPGRETNWIATAQGRPFFLIFRNHGPAQAALTRVSAWVLDDVDKIA